MPYEFILENISSRVVIMENNISEKGRYDTSLAENNDKNDLYHPIDSAENNDSRILNSCIYSNVNKLRQNQYLKLIFAINNFSNKHSRIDEEDKTLPIITYSDYGHSKPLNDWDNLDFFSFAFLALFFYGDGGYITPRLIKVSLHAWAKWALLHHSPQFA